MEDQHEVEEDRQGVEKDQLGVKEDQGGKEAEAVSGGGSTRSKNIK